MGPDSAVGIATHYELNVPGSNPGEARFSAPVQTGPGAHPSSYTIGTGRGELRYLANLGSEKISATYFKQCFVSRGGILPPRQSNTTPPSPKTEITNILFCILNFASMIKFKLFFNILPQQETKIKDYGTLPSIKIPIYSH